MSFTDDQSFSGSLGELSSFSEVKKPKKKNRLLDFLAKIFKRKSKEKKNFGSLSVEDFSYGSDNDLGNQKLKTLQDGRFSDKQESQPSPIQTSEKLATAGEKHRDETLDQKGTYQEEDERYETGIKQKSGETEIIASEEVTPLSCEPEGRPVPKPRTKRRRKSSKAIRDQASPQQQKQAHYLVVEIVYHGRALEAIEKKKVQTKVSQYVDQLLRRPQPIVMSLKEDTNQLISHTDRHQSPLSESTTVSPVYTSNQSSPISFACADTKTIKLSPQSRPLVEAMISSQQLPDTRCMRLMEAGSRAGNLQEKRFSSLGYDNSSINFNVMQTNSRIRNQKQSFMKDDKPEPNDSLERIMRFMNDEKRSTSATSQPRHYRRNNEIPAPSSSSSCGVSPDVVCIPTPIRIHDQPRLSAFRPLKPVGLSRQQAKQWRTCKEHEAWWMPRDWAHERRIGAFKQRGDEQNIREQEVELSKMANIEKIRTSNFIRM